MYNGDIHCFTTWSKFDNSFSGISADILIAANKQVLTQPKLVYQSADLMARSYYKDASGGVGAQTLGVWKGYVGFLYAHHVLTDADGKKLTHPPDYASYFTNAYMPRKS